MQSLNGSQCGRSRRRIFGRGGRARTRRRGKSGHQPDTAQGCYDYIIVGGGASGSIIAGELSKTGADVLVVESGGADAGPTISNPSIWFYNVGGPLDWGME